MNKYYGYIYKTTIVPTTQIYIGQKKGTIEKTRDYLGSGKILQAKVNHYGQENCFKEILSICKDKQDLNEMEIFWIEYFRSILSDKVLNITNGGEGFHGKHTEESKQNIRLAHLGKPKSPQAKLNMKLAQNRPEVKEKKSKNISIAKKGKPCSEQTRLKMSIAHLGKPMSEQAKENNRLAQNRPEVKEKKSKPRSEQIKQNMRKPKSEQTKQKMRKPKSEQAKLNMKLAQNRPEVKEKKSKNISIAHLGKPLSEEHKASISIALKGKSKSEMGHKENCKCMCCKAKRGEPMSEQAKQNMSIAHLGKPRVKYIKKFENSWWCSKDRIDDRQLKLRLLNEI
jgi:hypothetical protein